MPHAVRLPLRSHALRALAALAVALPGPVAAVQDHDGGLAGAASPPPGSLSDPEAYPRPLARASRTPTPPLVDGRVDEAVWAAAEVLTDFVQSQPDPGALATERTEVRILFDDEALYVGAVLYDSEPGHYVVQSLERDFPSLSTRDADIFAVTLDTFLDRRNSFIFLVNPYGAARDGQTFNDSRTTDFGFDVPTRIETAFRDDGWSLEIRIPWTGLRYDASRAEQSFGMNLLRRVRRKNEDSYWAPLERRDPAHRMSKAGTLVGIRDLPRARTLALKPYLLTDDQTGEALPREVQGTDAEVGFDLKYGLTAGLTLDATANTDFSQVEVDQEQVNLTRFPLFFEEQREFFVENSGVFAFGDQSERNYRQGASPRDFKLFHSRGIGLRSGRPVPILGGGKVSGTAGDWEVGLLDMRTEADQGIPGENFAVVRLKRKVTDGSDVGGMFIDRSSGSGLPDNRSYGVDANVHVVGGLIVNGYLAKTETDGATGDQTAVRAGVAWRDRSWNVSALYRRIGDDFNPAVGFVRRTNVEHIYATVGAHRRPPVPWIQEVAPFVEVHDFTTLGDTLLTREVSGGFRVDFTSGAILNAEVSHRFERVDAPFVVAGGEIAPGAYDFDEATLSFQSSAGRPLSADVRVSGGSFFDGDRRSVGGGLRWLASHRLAVQASADYNRIELPEGVFTGGVYSGRVKLALSTRAFWTFNLQYNDDVDQLVSYARFNVIHGPLSDLFLVFSERRHIGGVAEPVLERSFTAKVTRLLTF